MKPIAILVATVVMLMAAALSVTGTDKNKEKDPMKTASNSMAAGDAARYVALSDEELRKRLTPIQYRITRENGTEPPFNNPYWDNHDQGIYVDIVSGEPLLVPRTSSSRERDGPASSVPWTPGIS